MISILLPSRNRPENIERLWNSVKDTVDNLDDIELVIAVDEDDPQLEAYKKWNPIIMPRTVLSIYWNKCYEAAQGPIFMHCGDDIIFRTQGWDTAVKQAFAQYPDNVVFVHGDDGGGNGQNFGTHGFIHRDWAEKVGYFVPPHYASDYNDTHLNEVANEIGRRHYVDILTEHMHPAFGKGPLDITHQERLQRHRDQNVDSLYASKRDERVQDANKLRELIQN